MNIKNMFVFITIYIYQQNNIIEPYRYQFEARISSYSHIKPHFGLIVGCWPVLGYLHHDI